MIKSVGSCEPMSGTCDCSLSLTRLLRVNGPLRSCSEAVSQAYSSHQAI
jgi:hypothetical protein